MREYTLAWGKGVPDVYIEKLNSKTRQYEIKNLGNYYILLLYYLFISLKHVFILFYLFIFLF